MDSTRFDQLVRSLAHPASRRQAMGGLLGGALATVASAAMGDAKRRHPHARASGGNGHGGAGGTNTCAQFCQTVVPPGPARGRCLSDAAHGAGLCFQCGPAAPDRTLTLCRQACVNLNTDPANCGQCGHACAPNEACHTGVCRTPAGTCAAGQNTCASSAFCNGTSPSDDPFCECTVATSGARFCANTALAQCVACATDADCRDATGAGSACIDMTGSFCDCLSTRQRACMPPCPV